MTVCKLLSPDDNKPCKHYIEGNKDETGFCKTSHHFRCIEALKHYLPHVTQSALKTLMQCPYKYYLSYIEGIQVYDEALPNPIKYGAIWDTVLDCFVTNENYDLYKMADQYQLFPKDVARIQALINAFDKLDIDLNPTNDTLITQEEVFIDIGENMVTGYTDISASDHIKEAKLSSSPDFYTNIENIFLQVGTYLMNNADYKYCDMLITRLPQQRTGGKFQSETVEDFTSRLYSDIIQRPGYYFKEFKRDRRTYGVRFWRSEFDLDELRRRYSDIFKLLFFYTQNNLWPKNELSCHVPTRCQFHPIKRSGVISPELYYTMDVNEAAKGMR